MKRWKSLLHIGFIVDRSLTFHQPPFYASGLSAEVHTYLIQFTRIGSKSPGIVPVIYLLQGILGTAVQLELHHVNVLVRFHQQVYAAMGSYGIRPEYRNLTA